MPPKRAQIQSNSEEGKLALAVNAIRNKQIPSIRQAARVYEVDKSMIRNRLRGVKPRSEYVQKVAN
ncbi:hypothetical protein N7468_008036 [Penicillium chermesinum]|uniref:HTH psq-type domain-containing protein n=1 Tax=Penicillium chermesinum TaxID=63820 RepID=A0A9W9NRY1_9EURO|nr:uncharacterized protein N7468_008036 [Penicillium chermesinum]KAJ5223494.1 hypothetical protein N7468_008036 [Penicillium chermesinum]KAJ6155674.1 hypothetical protein N7470_006240 [Penicillium chermesinum]